jgi:CheY-like chemotaxis protein
MSEELDVVKAVPPEPFRPLYRALIEEAYIDPIRSVVVVDDEYPSLDSWLKQFVKGGNWNGDVDAAKVAQELLDFCRVRKRPWLVDIHDATNEEEDKAIIPQLHQSDLVILDYHLQGNEGQEKALRLIRALASNDHFNLVVVYTKGDRGEIRGVFWEIVEALTPVSWSGRFDEDQIASTLTVIRHWEDSDPGIAQRLMELVPSDLYLQERAVPGAARQIFFARVGELLRELPEGLSVKPERVFDWVLNQRHKAARERLAPEEFGKVLSNFRDDVNWIRLDNLFVTIVNKNRRPAELESGLVEALYEYGPSLHQLLMAKMRAQMDEKGADAEAEVLRDEFRKAGWLFELIDARNGDRRQLLTSVVDRQWQALGQKLIVEIDEYAAKLIKFVDLRGETEVKSSFVPNSISAKPDKVYAALNAYNCTKPIDRWHLTTGHIFSLPASGDVERTFWVCLSPACDLVPGQKSASTLSWFGRLGEFTPFIAVRLEKQTTVAAVENATSNTYVFFPVDGETSAFTFYPSADVGANPSGSICSPGTRESFPRIRTPSVFSGCPPLTAFWSVPMQSKPQFAHNCVTNTP